MINEKVEKKIVDAINEKALQNNCKIIAIGNTEDHIHVLVKISTTTVISNMVKDFKATSSYFVNQRSNENLYWQDGYGVLSISMAAVDKVKNYIENQKQKHSSNEINEYLEKACE